jgi:hypothetical protein
MSQGRAVRRQAARERGAQEQQGALGNSVLQARLELRSGELQKAHEQIAQLERQLGELRGQELFLTGAVRQLEELVAETTVAAETVADEPTEDQAPVP